MMRKLRLLSTQQHEFAVNTNEHGTSRDMREQLKFRTLLFRLDLWLFPSLPLPVYYML